MGNSDSAKRCATRAGWTAGADSLYTSVGVRKYLTATERRRVLEAAEALPPDQALFVLTLAWTGARLSEVLALPAASFDIDGSRVAIRTLKRRAFAVREMPIPPILLSALDAHFALRTRQGCPAAAAERLWPWPRVTGWRVVKRVMASAQVHGPHATPRGLRHAFGVGTLQSGVPLNLIQRWMGHARLSTTAIYAAASGPEEIQFARWYWTGAPPV